jgi:hypothetical protein
MDTSPVLESDEHILNLVTLTVKHAVMFDRRFAIGFDGISNIALGERLAELVGIIAFVTRSSLAFGRTASIKAAPL